MNLEKQQTPKYNGLVGLEDFVKSYTDYFEERYPDPESVDKIETWQEFLSFLDEGRGPMHSGEYTRHLLSDMPDETRLDLIGNWNQKEMPPIEGMYRTVDLPIEGKSPLRVKFFENGRLTFSWTTQL